MATTPQTMKLYPEQPGQPTKTPSMIEYQFIKKENNCIQDSKLVFLYPCLGEGQRHAGSAH